MTNKSTPRHHKLFWGSSYDRGLDILLFIWSDVKKKFPNAELHIAYGWDLFDVFARTNPERKQWKQQVEIMMNQEGVFHYGRVGKSKLSEVRKQCGIWAYPTYFTEINCITALEAQKDGLVPVTMTAGALNETVGSGVKIDGDIRVPEVKDKYLSALLDVMGNKENWKKESQQAQKWAKKYYWEHIASQWKVEFDKPVSTPKVSVITVTIRPGFWNIMANNLSKQTYKNFEWIIIDDHPEDRGEIARKYASKYNLDIKYIRGDKVLGTYKRRYGIARANNIGWKASQGELLVYLQDFILIPERGIEDLVAIYRHKPNALLAPTDIYYHCKKPNLQNTEDWFDGDTDIITNFSWNNVRNQHAGIRKTDNPFDFEMNWGAIPKETLNELNGWWEWMGDGLGFDNTEIAKRAQLAGYEILIDDTNKAVCIDLWPHIGGKKENIVERERHMNGPRWLWFERNMEKGTLPLVRDESLDEKISLPFTVPSEIKDEDCNTWILDNAEKLVEEWEKNIQL